MSRGTDSRGSGDSDRAVTRKIFQDCGMSRKSSRRERAFRKLLAQLVSCSTAPCDCPDRWRLRWRTDGRLEEYESLPVHWDRDHKRPTVMTGVARVGLQYLTSRVKGRGWAVPGTTERTDFREARGIQNERRCTTLSKMRSGRERTPQRNWWGRPKTAPKETR
jgi:hypothetical protein